MAAYVESGRSRVYRGLGHDSALKAAAREQEAPAGEVQPAPRKSTSFWVRRSTEAAMRVLDVAMSCAWHRELNCAGTPTFEWLKDGTDREMRLIEHKPDAEDVRSQKIAKAKRKGPQWVFFHGSDEEWREAMEADYKADVAVHKAKKRLRHESDSAWHKREREAAKLRRITPRTLRTDRANPATTDKLLSAVMVAELTVLQVIGEIGGLGRNSLYGLLLHLHPRPGFGPYAREGEYINRGYRTFRPVVSSPDMPQREVKRVESIVSANPHLNKYAVAVARLFGENPDPWLNEAIDVALEKRYREMVEAIASAFKSVKDLEELADLLELAEPGVRAPEEVKRSGADTGKPLVQKMDPGIRARDLVDLALRIDGSGQLVSVWAADETGASVLITAERVQMEGAQASIGQWVEMGWVMAECTLLEPK
jgi:hypothetical protein